MLFFLADGNPVRSAAQADSEEVAEGAGQLDHFLLIPCFRLPDDGVQRIVKKMGVDLSLQRPELRLLQAALVLHPLPHHILQVIRHDIHLARQVPQLLHLGQGQPCAHIPLRQLSRHPLQLGDGFPDKPGRLTPEAGRHRQRRQEQDQLDPRSGKGDPGDALHQHRAVSDGLRDIVVQHADHQGCHRPHLSQDLFVFHHRRLLVQVHPDLVHILIQRVHGSPGDHKLQLPVAAAALHHPFHRLVHAGNQLHHAAFFRRDASADHIPDRFRNLCLHDRLQAGHRVHPLVFPGILCRHKNRHDHRRDHRNAQHHRQPV